MILKGGKIEFIFVKLNIERYLYLESLYLALVLETYICPEIRVL